MSQVTYEEAFARLEKVSAIFDRAEIAHLSLRERIALKFLGDAELGKVVAYKDKGTIEQEAQDAHDAEQGHVRRKGKPVLATHEPIRPK